MELLRALNKIRGGYPDALPAAVGLVLRVAQPVEAEHAQVRDVRRVGWWSAPAQHATALLGRAGRQVLGPLPVPRVPGGHGLARGGPTPPHY